MEKTLKIILSNLLKFVAIFSPKLAAEFTWSFFCRPRVRKKPLSKHETELLQQAKLFFIKNEEYKIAVYQWQNTKNSDNAKTILFTHGWGGHALNFSHIIRRLLVDGFNVLAFDGPAHGKSSGKQTNLLRNTQALLAVTEKVTPIDVLIGHSFGSMSNAYAIDLAKDTMQLEKVNKIVLIAGPNRLADIFTSFIQTMQLPKIILRIFQKKVELLTKRSIKSMTTAEFIQGFNGQVLVVHDHKDRVVPHSEAEAVAKIPIARLFSTTGNGHGRILIADEVVEEISKFLSPSTIH